MKSYAVIGLGRFGTELAVSLYHHGGEVLAIDRDSARVQAVADSVTQAVTADATQREVLRELGVQDCDEVIVSMGTHLTESVLIVMNLLALNVPHIICKAHDAIHKEILEKLGAHRVIIPEHQIADKLARQLEHPSLTEYIELSPDYGVMEVVLPAGWVGNTLKDMHIRTRLGVMVVGIRRGDGMVVSPGSEERFKNGDVPVLLGSYEALSKFEKSDRG